MNYENDATGDHHPSEDDTRELDRLHAELGDNESDNGKAPTDSQKKQSVLVRTLHFLWRRRIFWHNRDTRELIEIVLAAGIFLAAATQAYIYWKQTEIMKATLGQNERATNLSMGQLAIANRNAASAESGGKDTHELAVQAKNQSNAMQASVNTAIKAMTLADRPWIGMVGLTPIQPDLLHDCPVPLYIVTVINVGHSPALNMTTEMEERFFDYAKFPDSPPYIKEDPTQADRITLVPGLPRHNQGGACNSIMDVDARQLNDITSRRWLYIYGRLLYDDQAGKHHHTYFCSYYIAANRQLAACHNYNDAD
jgi:hypothetical protein